MLGPSFAFALSTPHWGNSQVWSCLQLHAGGPSLAPYLPAHRAQGGCPELALSSGPCTIPETCCLILGVPGRRLLRSTEQGVLVPFARSATMRTRAFSVVGPMIWNGLPLELRLHPWSLPETFLTNLKTVLFGHVGV